MLCDDADYLLCSCVTHSLRLGSQRRKTKNSSQQVMVASDSVELQADQLVFWRPRQSEALLLQFGDLLVFDGQRITGAWPVLPASA